MSTYSWPVTLPQSPEKGYTETGGVAVLRTPMDSGIAKQRRRGAAIGRLAVSYIMTTQQVSALETFVINTLRGIARFDYQHPRTGQTVEVRIVPSSDGELFNLSYMAPDYWSVKLNLEIVP